MQMRGIVSIEWMNGMYVLPGHTNLNLDIQNSKLLENGYEFIDLSNCKSIEDIIHIIMEARLNTVVFGCKRETIVLIKEITCKLSTISKDLTFLWIVKGTDRSYTYNLESRNVSIYPDYHSLVKENQPDAPMITFEQIMEYLPNSDELSQNPVYKEAMNNGFCLMLTGKYPNSFQYSKSKHVYVNDTEILDQIFLADYMDLNSAIFIPASDYNKKKYLHWKNRYYNHIHVIEKDRILLDGNQVEVPWKVVGYSEYHHGSTIYDEQEYIPYLTFNSDLDINCFVEDIKLFSTTGKIQKYSFYLLHECKWANRCTLTYQMRFSLNTNGSVSPCSELDSPIYHILDDEYEKSSIRVKIMEQTQIRRKCKNCPASGWCTKCSFLPKGFSEEEFCNLMVKYPMLPDFINIKNILLMVKRYSSLNKTLNLGELEFSNYSHTLLLPETMIAKKPIDQNLYLFRQNDKYYFINPVKGQIIRIGVNLAYIIEGLQKGYTYDEIFIAYQKEWEDQPKDWNFQRAWYDVHNKILTLVGRGDR